MKKCIGIGIIGTGKIAHQLADAARSTEGVRTVAVFSRREETGRAFSESEGGLAVYTSLSEMLASAEVDAVYIASPNALHYGQASEAIGAGKHVLCEKPCTASYAECEALFRMAQEKGTVLLEAMRPLHDPMLALVRECLPLLGTLRRVDLEYCQYSSRYDRFKAGEVPNAFDPRLANAALMDIGIYPIACLVALLGCPERIRSQSLFLRGGFEGAGDILCEYNGLLATVSYSKITDSVTPSVITGEKGSLLIERLSATEKVTLHLRGEDARRLDYTPAPNNMVHELADFRDMVGGRLSPAPYRKYTLDTARMLDEVRRQNGICFG